MKYLQKFNENFKTYTKEQIKEIENNFIKVLPNSWERFLLDKLPDYSNIKFQFKTEKGLGYVAPFQREGDRLKHRGIEFSGIPTPEVWVHELWHYFTNPAFTTFVEDPQNCPQSAKEYTRKLSGIYERAKSLGYSTINGVSIHENLNEFAVNITNQNSIRHLKKIGLFDEYYRCQMEFIESY
jgi:hypothetical protein